MSSPQEKFISYINKTRDDVDTKYAVNIMQNYIIEFKCKDMLELGVARGFSTIGLLFTCPETNGHLWSVDNATLESDPKTWGVIQKAKEEIKKLDLDKYWTYTECDDLEYKCDREYDLIFIDSSHNYIETLLELKKFSKFIKVGKAIFLHDTLNITEGENVVAAVHRFLCREILREEPNTNSKWRYTELSIPYGLGVLERLR